MEFCSVLPFVLAQEWYLAQIKSSLIISLQDKHLTLTFCTCEKYTMIIIIIIIPRQRTHKYSFIQRCHVLLYLLGLQRFDRDNIPEMTHGLRTQTHLVGCKSTYSNWCTAIRHQLFLLFTHVQEIKGHFVSCLLSQLSGPCGLWTPGGVLLRLPLRHIWSCKKTKFLLLFMSLPKQRIL